MKRTLLVAAAVIGVCSSAVAGDAQVNTSWTGFYTGFNYGVGVAGTSMVSPSGLGPGGVADRTDHGGSAGGQVGFNWQYHPNWVLGVEGDFNWLDLDRKFLDFNDINKFGVKTDWFGTLRGRWGYASGSSLIYATGGAAWTKLKNIDDETASLFVSEKTAAGWAAGWGIETMLGGGWSTKAEYLYVDAGHNDVTGGGTTERFDNRFHVFRTGLNYHFGAPNNPLPSYNWGGAYAGFFGGASASEVQAFGGPFLGGNDVADTGFTGGVQAGYNWHITPMYVAGIEGDVGRLGLGRSRIDWHDGPYALKMNTDWYGTLRARLGVSAGSALIYGTAGGAFVNLREVYGANVYDKADFGWAYGGGLEVALGGNWTAKSEYLLIDLGSRVAVEPSNGDATFTNRFHVFRLGLNYKFGS